MSNKAENSTGLFRVSYVISKMPTIGAPTMSVDLVVDTVRKTVSGVGLTTQAVNPPMNVVSQFTGEWSYMCTMKDCHILVVAEGFDISPLLIGGHPTEYKNATLRMSLTEDWQSGRANFSYLHDGKWHEVEGAFVSICEQDNRSAADSLQKATKEKKPAEA